MTSSPNQPQKEELMDFSEFAALSALDILTSEESDLAEMNFADNPEFVSELAEFKAVVGAIAYSSPPAPMSNDLKDRLFQRISQDSAQEQSELFALLKLSLEELKQKTRDLSWELIPTMEQAFMATLEVDEAKKQVAFFVKAAAGLTFPNHWHAEGEEILVLAGDFVAEGQVYYQGDRIRSAANTSHQPSTINGCLIFCVSSVDDKFL